MKKLVVASTMVVFLVGLAGFALAGPGYHEVYRWGVPNPGWNLTDDCEMFSEGSKTLQYRWESAEGVGPCDPEYVEPTPEFPPPQFYIVNHVHLFPWIEVHISETHLTWDIFKPGDYMAKTFIIQLKANCPVLIHMGSGTWDVPVEFVDGKENGHIVSGPITKEGPISVVTAHGTFTDDDIGMEDKERERGLLYDAEGNPKNPGTPPDEIEVRLWWYTAHGDKPPAHEITAAEFALMPPKEDWSLAKLQNCERIIIPDTDELHKLDNTHVVFFEDLYVEQCDSEGKYQDIYAITITPDP